MINIIFNYNQNDIYHLVISKNVFASVNIIYNYMHMIFTLEKTVCQLWQWIVSDV